MARQKQRHHYWSYPEAIATLPFVKEKLEACRFHYIRMHRLHQLFKKEGNSEAEKERDRQCQLAQEAARDLTKKDIWFYDKHYRGIAIFPCRIGKRTEEGVLEIENAYLLYYDTRETIETYITDAKSRDLEDQLPVPETWKTQPPPENGILMVEEKKE